MSVRSGQSITVGFTTRRFDTGVATNADSLPTGKLYLNGVANAASVTVSLTADSVTGSYYASVTLPTLAIGDEVYIRISATVNAITDNGVIWTDTKDVLLDSSGDVTFNNTTIATATTVTNQLTAAQIATGIWQDTTSADFTTANSIGKSLYTTGNAPGAASGLALVGSNVGSATSVTGAVGSVTYGVTVTTNNDKTGYTLTVTPPTAAAIATAVWQDTTAADFTAALSIGKSIMNGVSLGTGLTINAYTGNTPQTGDNYPRLGAPAGTSVSADVLTANTAIALIKTATNTGVAPGASGGILISGSNAGTTTLGALTVTGATTFTGAWTATNGSNNAKVNVVAINSISAGSVTAIHAYIGTGQDLNFDTIGGTHFLNVSVFGSNGVAINSTGINATPGYFPVDFGTTVNVTSLDLSANDIGSVLSPVYIIGLMPDGNSTTQYQITGASLNTITLLISGSGYFHAGPNAIIVIQDSNTGIVYNNLVGSVDNHSSSTPTITLLNPQIPIPAIDGSWLVLCTWGGFTISGYGGGFN